MNPDASVSQAHLYFSGPDDNNRRGEWGSLIGSHQLGITKSTCHPRGFLHPRREALPRGPVGLTQRFTQTLHPHCQLDLVMPCSKPLRHDSCLSPIIYTVKRMHFRRLVDGHNLKQLLAKFDVNINIKLTNNYAFLCVFF